MIMIQIHYSGTALLLLHTYCIKTIALCTYLSSEKKTLCCQLCSTCYTAVQIDNCLKRTSAIKVATMKITDDFCYEWKPSRAFHKINFLWWAKMNGTQRRALVSPWRMHCIYNSTAKSTFWAEAMSNSEIIKPVAFAIIELHESKGIR